LFTISEGITATFFILRVKKTFTAGNVLKYKQMVSLTLILRYLKLLIIDFDVFLQSLDFLLLVF